MPVSFIDKTTENSGTPINREIMLALQGFSKSRVTSTKKRITEVYYNSDGSMNTQVLTTFNADGSIKQLVYGYVDGVLKTTRELKTTFNGRLIDTEITYENVK